MNNDNTTIILGPPGTGKTTRLLSILDEAFNAGLHPKDIAYVAFTRKAANEAKERAIEKFNEINPAEFKWFRTIHSLAYNVVRRSTYKTMRWSDYAHMGQRLGLVFSPGNRIQEDGTLTTTATKGDKLLFFENLARVRMVPLEQVWKEFPEENINYPELSFYAKALKAYKESTGKVDYTDFLYLFLKEDFNYNFKYVIVDEAQDLSRLQWEVIKKLTGNSEKIYVAGDDDQAIYKWAGADVNDFLDLQGGKIVLDQSYRVPAKVHELSQTIASRISRRNEKAYHPREEKGKIYYHSSVESLDLSEGSWLLLARNVFLLEQYNNLCLTSGVLFESRYRSDLFNSEMLEAIRIWEWLRKDKRITMDRAKLVYDFMSVRKGFEYGYKQKVLAEDDNKVVDMHMLLNEYGLVKDTIWHDALDKIPPEVVQYVVSCLKKGEKMFQRPRISINTIHGVKGGEADSVAIVTDMARRTYEEYQKDPDSEHRVWYVAVTRAKKNIHLIAPTSNYSYDVLWA